MPSTLPTPDELRQHPVVQALKRAYQYQVTHHAAAFQSPHQLWVGCSGGRDSMGLTYACVLADMPIRLIHVNHNIQAQATAWQQHVQQYAATWSLPCVIRQVHLPNPTETAARDARFDAIGKTLRNGDTLLLGHHADDQAETILMNLCSGTGLSGLSGMSTWSTRETISQDAQPHNHDKEHIHLWRPWLQVTRAEITDFVHLAQLDFIDDPTNFAPTTAATTAQPPQTADTPDTQHHPAQKANTRAFLRSHVLPQLSSHWPRMVNNIARTATIVAEAESILAEQTLTDLTAVSPSPNTLDITALTQLPIARQYRILSRWMQANATYAPPRLQVEQVHALAHSHNTEQQAQLHWHDIQIRRFKNQLYRLPRQLNIATNQTLALTENMLVTLPSGHWQVVKTTERQRSLPLHLLDKPLRLRPRRLGERLHIAGRVGSWPLKKFFHSQQVAPWQRDQAHILQNETYDIALICHAGFFPLADAVLPWHGVGTDTDTNTGWCLQNAEKDAEPAPDYANSNTSER